MNIIRAIIDSVSEAAIKFFTAKGRTGEKFKKREYFQHYGFTSRPLANAEAIILRQGNNIFCIATDDRRYRLTIENGEVAIYTNEGDYIHLKRENNIEIKTKTIKIIAATKVEIETPELEVSGNITTQNINCANIAADNITADGSIIDSAGNTNHHSHA